MSFLGNINFARTSINRAAGWDLEDDFDVDNWVDQDSGKIGVNTGLGQLVYSVVGDGTNDASSRALGFTADDTAFVYRWKEVIATLTDGTPTTGRRMMGISSLPSSSSEAVSQDYLGGYIQWFNTASLKRWFVNYADGESTDLNGTEFTHGPATETLFEQFVRLSSTSLESSFSSTDAYTKDIETQTITIPSSVIDLDELKIMNRVTTNSVVIGGNIQTLKFASGVTVPPT